MDDQLVREILIVAPEMSDAKFNQGGHTLYEQIRSAPAITAADDAKIAEWTKAMNKLYAEAEKRDTAAASAAAAKSQVRLSTSRPSAIARAGGKGTSRHVQPDTRPSSPSSR